MRYSLLAGGKRIRPVLALATARSLGRDAESRPAAGGAIELIHTYSLIHDDLPAMDDDDLRRGRPTCHVRYGEDVAILAGDGLYAEAFSLLLTAQQGEPANILRAARELAGRDGRRRDGRGPVRRRRATRRRTARRAAPAARAEDRPADRRERRMRLPDRGRRRRAPRPLPGIRARARAAVPDRRRHPRRDRDRRRSRQAVRQRRAPRQAHLRHRARSRRSARAGASLPSEGP